MSKRPMLSEEKDCYVKRLKTHWSLDLIESMKDPNMIYKETENIVVIKDKYPKAKIHYLMLPKDDISSIHNLNKEHIYLLEDFGTLLEDINKEHKDVTLRAGFHAVPSMRRLHMHIISTDMISPCLKKRSHWNSFETSFFIPYQDLMRQLKLNGSITKMSTERHKELMATPLRCNQCLYQPKNMPKLKEHLLTHVE